MLLQFSWWCNTCQRMLVLGVSPRFMSLVKTYLQQYHLWVMSQPGISVVDVFVFSIKSKKIKSLHFLYTSILINVFKIYLQHLDYCRELFTSQKSHSSIHSDWLWDFSRHVICLGCGSLKGRDFICGESYICIMKAKCSALLCPFGIQDW